MLDNRTPLNFKCSLELQRKIIRMPDSRTPLFFKYAVRASVQRRYRTRSPESMTMTCPGHFFFLGRFFFLLPKLKILLMIDSFFAFRDHQFIIKFTFDFVSQ
jgi:hypothetical protein